ncbi:MAG: response regulator transcription factor [Opitutales bacterium]|nr:response regulator transcription factor [Opitutales bacterium]
MKKTLFLIEDEDLLCDLFAEYVEFLPEISYLGDARDGATALRRCRELSPNIVIMDLRMPEVDGLQVLSWIRKELPSTKVIIFSGTVDDEALRAAMDAETDAFIEKAYGLEELRRGLEYVLNDRRYFSPGILKLLTNYHIA